MSSRYRVEYNLKAHRKDAFIQWVKGLLAVPFVLQSVSEIETDKVYGQFKSIFEHIEKLIEEKIAVDIRVVDGEVEESRLDQLVPQLGTFFTPLPMVAAFEVQENKRAICKRRMVSPSFNDIRHILNSAQILAFSRSQDLRLMTFDGDVTLYEDGGSITKGSKIVSRLMALLDRGIHVGIVTAAGYDDPEKYKERLYGLCWELFCNKSMSLENKKRLTIMGGESSYLFQYYEVGEQFGFMTVDEELWTPQEVKDWAQDDIAATLDLAESSFYELKKTLLLPEECEIIRKKKAVGIVPGFKYDPELKLDVKRGILRENLEEMVLVVHKRLDSFKPAKNIAFSCFDGGSDVWCDIGGKDIGVQILQSFFCSDDPIKPTQTLHVGDQFASKGSANDFKARSSACTIWISSPQETIDALDELLQYI